MPQLAPLSWILVPVLLWFVLISLFSFGYYMNLLSYPRQKFNLSNTNNYYNKWNWKSL